MPGNFARKMKQVFSMNKKMHKASKVPRHKRALVPTALRVKMFKQIVGEAYETYGRWLADEVKKREKKR